MLLKAVMTFLLSAVVWLIVMQFIDYIMDLMVENVTIYYPTNVNLFIMTLSFLTIFGLVAFGIRAITKREMIV